MKWQVWNDVEPIGLGAGREIVLGFTSGHQLKNLIPSKQTTELLRGSMRAKTFSMPNNDKYI